MLEYEVPRAGKGSARSHKQIEIRCFRIKVERRYKQDYRTMGNRVTRDAFRL